MSFQGVIGQKSIIDTLEESLSQKRLNHAYLFCGPQGIGKKTLAYAFAKRVTCTNSQSDNFCGSCQACLLNKNDTNPEIIWAEKEPKKASFGIDPIRDNVIKHATTAPVYSEKKVFIIKDAQLMTVDAQNALLKLLEEPPAYVMFILVCTNASVILDTIKSRVCRLDFARYSDGEIIEILKNSGMQTTQDPGVFAYADGIPGRAIEYFNDEEINQLRMDLFSDIKQVTFEGCIGRLEAGKHLVPLKEKKEFVFFTLLSYYRDVALISRYGKGAEIQNKQQIRALSEIAEKIGFYKAEKCLGIIDETWNRLRKNVNYELGIGYMLIKIQEVIND